MVTCHMITEIGPCAIWGPAIQVSLIVVVAPVWLRFVKRPPLQLPGAYFSFVKLVSCKHVMTAYGQFSRVLLFSFLFPLFLRSSA